MQILINLIDVNYNKQQTIWIENKSRNLQNVIEFILCGYLI